MSSQPASSEITSDDKLWALLCYLLSPWLSLVILLFLQDKKERPFLKYHYMQALAWGVVWYVLGILVIGCFLSPIALIGSIYFGVKAYQGEYVVIPLLTDFMKKQGWIS